MESDNDGGRREFAASTLGKLRALVGRRLLHVPGARVVLLNERGEYLLQKRRDFEMWGLPGGNAEDDEGVLESLSREIYEETGLTVRTLHPFGFGDDPQFERIMFPNGDECHFHALMFYATEFEGELRCDEESLALDWFAPEHLPDNMLPNMRRSIEAYKRFRLGGGFQII